MAHVTTRGAYRHLADRLNRFPQGAPPSDLLYRILALLFSEREAALVARLPIRPFTVADRGPDLEDERGRGASRPRRAGLARDAPRHGGPGRDRSTSSRRRWPASSSSR